MSIIKNCGIEFKLFIFTLIVSTLSTTVVAKPKKLVNLNSDNYIAINCKIDESYFDVKFTNGKFKRDDQLDDDFINNRHFTGKIKRLHGGISYKKLKEKRQKLKSRAKSHLN